VGAFSEQAGAFQRLLDHGLVGLGQPMAAMHSSCIRRGATLAVTLTLPWPPSSISATAVPSSPE
jgi:hypothetical protein